MGSLAPPEIIAYTNNPIPAIMPMNVPIEKDIITSLSIMWNDCWLLSVVKYKVNIKWRANNSIFIKLQINLQPDKYKMNQYLD